MTQLLLDNEGREAIREAMIDLARRRLARHWKRDFVRAFESWRTSGTFDRSVLIGAMNDALDDEIRDLYRLLAACGALPVTVGDLEYHVDQTVGVGSDITGDGSATAPYATMWFLDYLPATIRHHVRILIHADHSEYNINTSRFCVEHEGLLTFAGAAAPEVLSSNHEVSSVLTSYNGLLFTAPVALEEALAGGWWVQQTDAGAYQYWAAPILSNKADTIWYPSGDGTEMIPSAGNICRIIRPSISLSVDYLTLAHNAIARREGALAASSRVTFANLRIDIDKSAGGIYENALFQSPTAFTFCSLVSGGSTCIEGQINYRPSVDAALMSVTQSTIKNLSSTTAGMGPGVNTAGLHLLDSMIHLRNGSFIRDAVIDADIVMWGTSQLHAAAVRGEINAINCTGSDGFYYIDPFAASIHWVLSLVPADGGNTLNVYNSTINIDNLRFVNRTGESNYTCIQAWALCNLTLRSIGQDTTFPATFPHVPPDHGIVFGTWGTRLYLTFTLLEFDPTSASVNLEATVAGEDIRWEDGVLPTLQAWPVGAYMAHWDTIGISLVQRGAL